MTDDDRAIDTIAKSIISAIPLVVKQQMKDINLGIDDKINEIKDIKTAVISNVWVGASAPYTQTISVIGVTINDNPIISPVYSNTDSEAILEKTAWNLIGSIETNNNSITVTCFEDKTVTPISIKIKGV